MDYEQFGFRWKESNAEKPKAPPVKQTRKDHRDPTADIAISRVMREQRRQEHRMQKQSGQTLQTASRGGQEQRKTEQSGQKQQKESQHMRESEIEKAFVDAVKEAGGVALKFTSQTMNGVPDRLILFKIGKCAFVELKASGKQMRPLQRKRRRQLETLGFPVFCIDAMDQIQPVIRALKRWNPGDPIPRGVGAKIPEIKTKELPGDDSTSSKGVGTSQAVDESKAMRKSNTENKSNPENKGNPEDKSNPEI